jgi:hypothetical protein
LGGEVAITTWTASPLEKVLPDTPAPAGTTGVPVLRISAARGEVEARQLCLHTANAVEVEAAEAAALSPRADLPLDARPTAVAVMARARLVEYVKVTKPSHGQGTAGLHPDPLMPFRPFTVKGTRALWIDVAVPREAPAGRYRGTLRLRTNSAGTLQVPVELLVYDFALPFPPRLVTAFGLYARPLRERYGEARYDEMLAKFRRNLAEHRITHVSFPPTDIPRPDVTVKADGSVKLDYAAFDRAVEANLRLGMNALDVPVPAKFRGRDKELRSPYSREVLEKIIADMQRHLVQRGWDKIAYFFLVDEPGRRSFDAFRDIEQMLHRVAPRIRRRLDMGYGAYGGRPGSRKKALYRKFAGLVEIWVPHIDCVDQEFLEAEQKKGNEVWWYICCSARHPYPNCLVDFPLLDSRIPFWMIFNAKATGYAYWTVNWWNKDPFKDPRSFANTNGDGMLIYPGPDGPIDSIRWEATRDGCEDYEYLVLLADRVKAATARGRADKAVEEGKAVLAEVRRIAPSPKEYAKNPEALLEVRDRVARAIEALSAEANTGRGVKGKH